MTYMATLFFFNDTATTEIYTLSLHDALPISGRREACGHLRGAQRVRVLPGRRHGAERAGAWASRVLLRAAHRPQDRKSTRLNSSHANISYAVFCLKKKNTPYLQLNTRSLLSR